MASQSVNDAERAFYQSVLAEVVEGDVQKYSISDLKLAFYLYGLDGGVQTGDTGWRDISGNLVNGAVKGGGAAPTGGSERTLIRRTGSVVTLNTSIAIPAWTAGTAFLNVPAGFRTPVGLTYMPDGYSGAANVTSTGPELRYHGTAANAGLRYLWTYATDDAWPTALPGIAA